MTGHEPRQSLGAQLEGIATSLAELGERVVAAVREATRVLLESDLDGARRVVEGDDELDARTIDIEERCLDVLTLYTPRAGDLRSVVAALRMASEIERCGDLAANIAKAARRLYHVELDPRLRGMVDRMSRLAERQLHSAVVAYTRGDEAWAAALDDLDDELDDLHREFVETILGDLRGRDADLRVGVQLALVGRFYERLGDHAVNIGERIRYQLSGWTPEQSGAVRHAARQGTDPATVADIADVFARRDVVGDEADDAEAVERERRRVDELRRDFVANIGHELRTPLGAVAVLAETLRAEIVDQDRPADHVVDQLSGRIVAETDRLTSLVEDLLELSRIESGEPLDAGPVPVARVIDEALGRTRGAAEGAGVTVTTQLASGPDDDGGTVYADGRQLVSALTNLIANAVRYSDSGRTVTVGADTDGDGTCRFTVTDHGIGIPRADLPRIFERFHRVDRARRRDTGGTGLGLAIVRHVAVNHGGTVSVDSVEGEGSTFTMTIPPREVGR